MTQLECFLAVYIRSQTLLGASGRQRRESAQQCWSEDPSSVTQMLVSPSQHLPLQKPALPAGQQTAVELLKVLAVEHGK